MKKSLNFFISLLAILLLFSCSGKVFKDVKNDQTLTKKDLVSKEEKKSNLQEKPVKKLTEKPIEKPKEQFEEKLEEKQSKVTDKISLNSLPNSKTLQENQINGQNVQKVKVAALLPLSGKNKEMATSILNSITLSLFENDKENNVELLIFDSKDGLEIKKVMQDIAKQGIKIVIGPVFSADVEAVADIIVKNNIILLSLSNNQDLISNTAIIHNVFLMGFLPEQQIERITSYAIDSGKDSIAIIAPKNQYGIKFTNILKEMVKIKDGNFITSQLYDNNNQSIEIAVKRAINSFVKVPSDQNVGNFKTQNSLYANAILVPESGVNLLKIIDLIKKMNVTKRPIQIMGSSNWDEASNLNNPNLNDTWLVSVEPDKYSQFEKRYYQVYNKFPMRIASIGYDSALAIINVAKQTSKTNLNQQDFVNYQSSNNGFEGIDGLFRFLPNGIVQRNFAILTIRDQKFEVINKASKMFFKY